MDRSLLRQDVPQQANISKLTSLASAYKRKSKLGGPKEPRDLDFFRVRKLEM